MLGSQIVQENSLNFFMIETELQYLAYIAIKDVQENECALIFTTSERVFKKLFDDGIDSSLISRNSHGWIGRLKKIRANLFFYKKSIQEQGHKFLEINLHFPRIDNVHNNIVINYLKYHFRDSKINVRLIPDGAINIFSSNLTPSKLKKQKRWINSIGFKFIKDLEYYPYGGDELGADSDIVDRIYCFEGVKTGYPENKLCMIKLPILGEVNKKNEGSVLVIGQNFLQLNTASLLYVEKVSSAICQLVNSLNANRIDYAPHPRSNYNEFSRPEYNFIDNDYLCIEEKIAEGGYEHIISCYSSALINSKIMLGDSINTYSLGLDSFPFPDPSQRKKLIAAYKSLGVTILSVEEQNPTS
tara:strand:+ start:1013 stop:2083 length:1071 start_codon:yes stop_codon:yes gene_type:complete